MSTRSGLLCILMGREPAKITLMKLTDFLEDVGRPVAYYPSLALALGGVKQAVLLCQIIYWTGKGSDPEGWIYKTAEELQEETGLSYEEQLGARKVLVRAGVLEEWNQRLIHRMNYRVNKDVLNELWEERFSPSGESPFPDLGKTHFGNTEKPISGNGKSPTRYKGTETTPETTAEMTPESFPFKKMGLAALPSNSSPTTREPGVFPEDFDEADFEDEWANALK